MPAQRQARLQQARPPHPAFPEPVRPAPSVPQAAAALARQAEAGQLWHRRGSFQHRARRCRAGARAPGTWRSPRPKRQSLHRRPSANVRLGGPPAVLAVPAPRQWRRAHAPQNPAAPAHWPHRAAHRRTTASARGSRPILRRGPDGAAKIATRRHSIRRRPAQTAAGDSEVRICRWWTWQSSGSYAVSLTGSAFGLQQRPQLDVDGLARPEDARAHRSDRAIHLLRDFVVAQALHLAQGDGQPKFFR